jgi:hypothetical protein
MVAGSEENFLLLGVQLPAVRRDGKDRETDEMLNRLTGRTISSDTEVTIDNMWRPEVGTVMIMPGSGSLATGPSPEDRGLLLLLYRLTEDDG